MARIKDFAKDFNLDIKDALDLIKKAGLGDRQSGANIESDEISKVVNMLTLDRQCKGIDDYLDGKNTITSEKKKAKMKAEAEAKAKAEAEAKAKAEAEAKAKAEAEAKAKAKAEAEAKAKAEAEAKAKAEAEAKAKAEAEAKAKAEAKARAEQKPQQGKNDRFANKPFEQRQGGYQQNGYQKDGGYQREGGYQKDFNRDKPFNKDGKAPYEKKEFGAQGNRNNNNNNGQYRNNNNGGGFFDKDKGEKKTYNVTPKQKKPESNVIEIKTKTGETKVVDTRISDVDLSKYDEKFDNYEATHGNYGGGAGKQKLKKQNNKDSFGSSKKERERQAMEKMKKAAFEKAKNTQLSITVPDEITVGELASRLKVNSGEIVKKLMMMGVMASVNQTVDFDTAYLIGDELGAKVTKEVVVTIEEKLFEDEADAPEALVERAPVVCVMGHVDHGKTSLLDAIRHTHVTTGEAGGITQHIGAYRVNINGKDITFLDTPGHEAFTAMRLRGAMATDIAIIVVAADDGIMPQTVEAINHAKAAGVDIVVAINKMDKPTANPENIKQELTKYDLVPEEWGGDIMCIPVSAHTKMGMDDLLESVLLIAEVKELKANPKRLAKGIVIEAKLDKGRGPVATILVQNGTLKSGDVVIAGTSVGRVRAMTDHNGKALKVAGPSVPVEITGLSEVPNAGDEFNAVKDERMARELAEQRRAKAKEEIFKANAKVNLDDLFSQINDGVKELNIIVKADVGGSCEAVKASLVKLSNAEVKVNVIHAAAGGITESDVTFAAASNAIIVGFNVRPDKVAIDSAERQGVDIRTHRIIYEIIEEIEAAMKGMLAPTFKEVIYGHAEVRQTIRVPGVGTIAGCYVQDGKIIRSASIRIIRDGIVIAEDKIASLKRFKDDAKEVNAGYECGVGLDKFNDIKENDVLEAFGMEEVEK